MALDSNEKRKYAITPFVSSGSLTSTNTDALGTLTNAVTIYTAPSTGARVYSLIASTDDTAAVNIRFYIKSSGGTARPIANVNVPLRSGDIASTLMVDCLNPLVSVGLPIDENGKRYIEMGNGDLLVAHTITAMTALKTAYVTAQGAEY